MAKLTIKQENFCLNYIETGNATEAYRVSYNTSKMKPETINRTAKETMDNPNIAARIAELRKPIIQKVLKKYEITVDDLVRELEQNRQAALTAPVAQSSAAVAATMGKAKLLGLIVDKSENKTELNVATTVRELESDD